ncbi:O-antigen translocase [Erwinia sp. P7711]|uniref:O-antigen translocase n=1 Tax=Erwinia sp. P7711 TaxID=3141451 RepID=UPI00318FD899
MKKLLSVTFFTALLTLVRMAAGFFIAKIVAVYTGPAGMGMLGQVQSMLTAINGVATSPVGNGVVRYTSQNYSNGYEACAPWWRAALQWSIGIFLIIFPLSVLFSQSISIYLFNEPKYYWIIIISSGVLPFSVINTFAISIINGQQLYKRYVIAGMISVSVSTLVMVALIVKWNLNGALLAAALNLSISGIVILLISLRQPWLRLKYFFGKVEKENIKAIYSYVLMSITSALAMPLALVFIRNIMVAHLGWELTGLWQAVWKISEVYLAIVTLALSTYYLPKLSSLSSLGEIRKEIHITAKVIMPLVCLMAISIYFLRDVAITVLFTEQFRAARDIFAIQLVGDVLKILSWLYAFPMLAKGATRWFIFSEVFFSLTFIALSYLFITKFGIQGASIGFACNYLMYFIFVYFNLDRIAK